MLYGFTYVGASTRLFMSQWTCCVCTQVMLSLHSVFIFWGTIQDNALYPLYPYILALQNVSQIEIGAPPLYERGSGFKV